MTSARSGSRRLDVQLARRHVAEGIPLRVLPTDDAQPVAPDHRETLAAIREAYGIPVQENLSLRDYPTLQSVIGFVYAMRPDLQTIRSLGDSVTGPAPALPITQSPNQPITQSPLSLIHISEPTRPY